METKKDSIYTLITNQIVKSIENGLTNRTCSLPWYSLESNLMIPKNVVTSSSYKGINILILWLTAEVKGYKKGSWATFKQWQTLGGKIKKGEKSTLIVYSERFKKEDEESEEKQKTYYVTKGYNVFNIEQLENPEGLTSKIIDTNNINVGDYFSDLNINITHGGDSAFYSISKDTVNLPNKNRFKSIEGYYSTLCHEIIHWTAHETRLNRNLKNRFGSESYAMEELIAELGAAFLCSELKITNKLRNDHAKYINNWLTVLKNDSRAIFSASAKAQQAVEWIKDNKQQNKIAA